MVRLGDLAHSSELDGFELHVVDDERNLRVIDCGSAIGVDEGFDIYFAGIFRLVEDSADAGGVTIANT